MDGRRHAFGDRDRAGLPHPARGRVGRRAPRLAGQRRGGLPALARPWLRHRGGGGRERGVEGKRVDLGGRRIIKKKKKERTVTSAYMSYALAAYRIYEQKPTHQ